MTVNEYRQKHKRCKFCEYCSTKSLLDFMYSQSFTWCVAKKRETNENMGRFCKVFKLKELNENENA